MFSTSLAESVASPSDIPDSHRAKMEWLLEDAEALDASLALLEAWDGSHQAAGAVKAEEPPPFAPCAPPAPPANARVVNTSRERRRRELLYLRQKVTEMQQQLTTLRQRREEMLRPHYDQENDGQLVTVAPVWEGLATRQIQARKKAELENAKLKGMLAAQVRIAQELILAIQLAADRSRDDSLLPKPQRLPIAIDASQRMSEEQQLARLEVMCADWMAPFISCGKFNGGPLQFFDMHAVQHSETETVLEISSSAVLPYKAKYIDDVLWKVFLEDGSDDEGNSFTQDCDSTDDQVIAVFTNSFSIGDGQRAVMQGKYVTKRIRTEIDNVVVTHMYSEPQRHESNILQGVCMFDESWVRVVDADKIGHKHFSAELAVMQHIQRIRIDFDSDDDQGPSQSRVETLTNLFMKQVEKEFKWVGRMIENALLQHGSNGSRAEVVSD